MKLCIALSFAVLCLSCVSAGAINTAKWSTFVPLTGPLVVAANADFNSIDIINVDQNITLSQILLETAPTGLVADLDYGVFYATLFTNKIVRVDIFGEIVTYINVAPGNICGDISVTTTSLYVLCKSKVFVLNKFTLAQTAVVVVDQDVNAIVASSKDEFFIGVILGIQTYDVLYRFAHNATGWFLSQIGTRKFLFPPVGTVTLSPDGKHVLLVMDKGVSDWNATDFRVSFGEFTTGSFPVGASYTQDQKYMVTSAWPAFPADGATLYVFDTKTYKAVVTFSVNTDNKFTSAVTAVSYDGARAYNYGRTGTVVDSGKLYWFQI